jgi:hypothetical protein
MLGDYPRDVTITVENRAGASATATFVVVGKQTTDLPVELVVEEGDFLRIESPANRVTFEGRFARDRDEIAGSIDLGSFELRSCCAAGRGAHREGARSRDRMHRHAGRHRRLCAVDVSRRRRAQRRIRR